jgi:hypothetical protein
LGAIRQLHEASHPLTEIGILYPDHGSVMDGRMGYQDALDFDWRDFRAGTNNQVLLAGNEPEIALAILSHEVAGMKPTLLRCFLDLPWPDPVADGNMGSAHDQFSYLASRYRHLIVIN